MGLSAIVNRKYIGSYNISDYGDKTKSLLTILCLTNDKNFERNRKTIIKRAVGIPSNKEPKDTLEIILQEGLLSRKKWGDFSDAKVEVTKSLAKELLEGNISPYQATGKLKEINPTLTSKDMTELWTKLSIVIGLENLGNKGLEKDWNQDIEQNSLNPRVKNLSSSINDKNRNNSIISKTYRENYPHLKDSKIGNINWAEIICNLSPQVAGITKCLLNSSKNKILKKETAQEALFPRQSPHEIENRRLSNLLSTVGNFHNNREKRYQRIMFNLENYRAIPQLPKVAEPTASEAELKKTKAIIRKVERKLEEHNITANPKRLTTLLKANKISKYEMFDIRKSILQLRKINSPEAQSSYKMWEVIIKDGEKELAETKLLNMLDKGNDIPQSLILERIINLDQKGGPEDFMLGYIKHIEPTKENLDYIKLQTSKNGPQSQGLKNFLERDLVDKPPPETWGRGITLIESLTNDREYSAKLPVGAAKRTPLQIASLLGMPEEVNSIAESIKTNKDTLNPTLEDGRTPLFLSNPEITRILLRHGANYNAKDPKGQKAENCNPHKESRAIIKEFKAKMKVKELIKQENDGIDTYLP
jgi:hypothetical protein